jgi:hypothetical protein
MQDIITFMSTALQKASLRLLLGLIITGFSNYAFADSKVINGGKATQSIYIVSPKAGTIFAPGAGIEVSWTSQQVGEVNIYISKGNKKIASLAKDVAANKKSHKIIIPKSIEPNPDVTKFSYYLEIASGSAAVRDKVMIVIK